VRRRIAIPLAAMAVLGAGCGGDDELAFSAEEFVSEVNGRGASLTLGPPLRTEREATEIYELVPAAGGGGGSLTVTADAATGLTEYRRCEAAATLLCFRANNVVVALDHEVDPEGLTRLQEALTGMAVDASG
jgi:hypothetical protein